MSKHARVEALRKLKEQLAVETNPDRIVKITNSIAKLSPRQTRRSRKDEAKTTTPSNAQVAIIDRITGSAVDQLPDGEKVSFWIGQQIEKMRREQKRTFTSEEFEAEFIKLIEGLSARDRAALEAGERSNEHAAPVR